MSATQENATQLAADLSTRLDTLSTNVAAGFTAVEASLTEVKTELAAAQASGTLVDPTPLIAKIDAISAQAAAAAAAFGPAPPAPAPVS